MHNVAVTEAGTIEERAPQTAPNPAPPTRVLDWARRRGWTRDHVTLAVAVAVAVAIALWLTAGVWGDRAPAGEDVMGHLVLTRFGIENLFGDWRINGWSPNFMLGFETFMFLGPGLALAVALVQVLSLGQLSVMGAFKVVDIASFVALPVAVSFLARSFGLSLRAAGLAAILTLTVNSPFGGAGLQGLFGVGLVPHQFGAVFFCLSLGGILRVLHRPTRRWALFTGVTLAILVISHARSLAMLAVILAIILATVVLRHWVASVAHDRLLVPRRDALVALVRREVRSELAQAGLVVHDSTPPTDEEQRQPDVVLARPAIRHLAAAGFLAVGLAGLYLLPVLAHRDLQGSLAGWAAPSLGQRLSDVWEGNYLFRQPVPLAILAGWLIALVRVRERRPYALALVATPIAYLAFAHWADRQWPGNLITYQLPVRGLGYAALLAILPLSAALGRVTRRHGGSGDVVAVGAACALVILPLGSSHDVARQMPQPIPQLREAASQIRQLVPPGARYVTERDYPTEIDRIGVINPDRWLAWSSRRNTLNLFSIESSRSAGPAFEAEYFDEREPEEIADALSRFGVTHVVTVSDPVADKMAASPRFGQAWRSSPVAIFAVLPRPGQPSPASLMATDAPASARLLRADPEHLQIEVDAMAPTRATVAVGWSPKWRARLDGQPVRLGSDSSGLLELALPAGRHSLHLDFGPDVWDYLGVMTTLGTLVGICTWIVLERRRRRPPASSPSSPE